MNRLTKARIAGCRGGEPSGSGEVVDRGNLDVHTLEGVGVAVLLCGKSTNGTEHVLEPLVGNVFLAVHVQKGERGRGWKHRCKLVRYGWKGSTGHQMGAHHHYDDARFHFDALVEKKKKKKGRKKRKKKTHVPLSQISSSVKDALAATVVRACSCT